MKLIKLEKTYLLVDSSSHAQVRGSIEHLSRIMMGRGVADDEIDLALSHLSLRKHNVAHFGVYGTFMFSEKAA